MYTNLVLRKQCKKCDIDLGFLERLHNIADKFRKKNPQILHSFQSYF